MTGASVRERETTEGSVEESCTGRLSGSERESAQQEPASSVFTRSSSSSDCLLADSTLGNSNLGTTVNGASLSPVARRLSIPCSRSPHRCMAWRAYRQPVSRSLPYSAYLPPRPFRLPDSTLAASSALVTISQGQSRRTAARASHYSRRTITTTQHTNMSATAAPAASSSSASSPLFAPKSVQLFPAAIPALSAFYQQTQQLLQTASKTAGAPPITIVMGNESSDFDSTVSATVLAWYLNALASCSSSPSPTRYCPVINVPRRYFHLRTEIAAEFQRLSVDVSHVTFVDDVELRAVKAHSARFGVVLTDHNQLTEVQSWMGDSVVGVVDHHEDELLYPSSTANRVMGRVGSCCTHVTNILRDNHPELLTASFDFLPIVQLLTDVILIDTHNMNPELKKATAADVAAMDYLTNAYHTLAFTHLKALRNDVQGWTTEDLLLKDTKVYNADGYGVMISTVPMPLDDWARQDPAMVQSLARCAKGVDALIVLTSFTDKRSKQYKRDLLLITPMQPPSVTPPQPAAHNETVERVGQGKPRIKPEELFERLARGLEADDRLRLRVIDSSRQVDGLSDGERSAISGLGAVELGAGTGLVKEDEHGVLVRRYDQQNVASSRKQVAPAVEAILSKL